MRRKPPKMQRFSQAVRFLRVSRLLLWTIWVMYRERRRVIRAHEKGNQVFGPYANPHDFQGSINTAKGFTGQYNDSLTELDYYQSRYYEQVAGVFLSNNYD
jgi:hypothetical protein